MFFRFCLLKKTYLSAWKKSRILKCELFWQLFSKTQKGLAPVCIWDVWKIPKLKKICFLIFCLQKKYVFWTDPRILDLDLSKLGYGVMYESLWGVLKTKKKYVFRIFYYKKHTFSELTPGSQTLTYLSAIFQCAPGHRHPGLTPSLVWTYYVIGAD